MEKTAKQLFEELGWECDYIYCNNKGRIIDNYDYRRGKNIYAIVYDNYKQQKNDDNSSSITFYIKDKYMDVATDVENYNTQIDLSLLKAINKQVEELGWRKEEENE